MKVNRFIMNSIVISLITTTFSLYPMHHGGRPKAGVAIGGTPGPVPARRAFLSYSKDPDPKQLEKKLSQEKAALNEKRHNLKNLLSQEPHASTPIIKCNPPGDKCRFLCFGRNVDEVTLDVITRGPSYDFEKCRGQKALVVGALLKEDIQYCQPTVKP